MSTKSHPLQKIEEAVKSLNHMLDAFPGCPKLPIYGDTLVIEVPDIIAKYEESLYVYLMTRARKCRIKDL